MSEYGRLICWILNAFYLFASVNLVCTIAKADSAITRLVCAQFYSSQFKGSGLIQWVASPQPGRIYDFAFNRRASPITTPVSVQARNSLNPKAMILYYDYAMSATPFRTGEIFGPNEVLSIQNGTFHLKKELDYGGTFQLSFPYQVRAPIDNEGHPIDPHYVPFYQPAGPRELGIDPAMLKLFPAKTAEVEVSRTTTENKNRASKVSLSTPLEYPEIQVSGILNYPERGALISEKYIPIPNPNNLYESPTRAVRLQRYALGSKFLIVYDVVPIKTQYTPGYTARVMSRVDPAYHGDVYRLLRTDLPYHLWGKEKLLDKILSLQGVNIGDRHQNEIVKSLNREALDAQKQILDPILDFVVDLYKERRGWGQQKVNTFRDNGYKTRNNTRYSLLVDPKKPTLDAKSFRLFDEELYPIGAIGVTKAAYGIVRFFCKKRQQYVELMGPFGTAYEMYHAGNISEEGKIPPTAIWNANVPITPVESEGFPIFRPRTLDTHLMKNSDELALLLSQDNYLRLNGYEIDLTKKVEFYMGALLEPVKFGVLKNLGDNGLVSLEMLTRLMTSMFPMEISADFVNEGQMLVSYNTREGIRMYKKIGLEPQENMAPIADDEAELWFHNASTPLNMLNTLSDSSRTKSLDLYRVLSDLQQRLDP